MDDKTYKIVRFYHPSQKKDKETIAEGLTLEEAKSIAMINPPMSRAFTLMGMTKNRRLSLFCSGTSLEIQCTIRLITAFILIPKTR